MHVVFLRLVDLCIKNVEPMVILDSESDKWRRVEV